MDAEHQARASDRLDRLMKGATRREGDSSLLRQQDRIQALVAKAAPALSRLVSSEIGGRRSPGRGWAIFALLMLGAYDFGRYLAHERVLAMLDTRIYRGETPLRLRLIDVNEEREPVLEFDTAVNFLDPTEEVEVVFRLVDLVFRDI